MRQAVPAGVEVIEAINPSTLAKSRKSEAEIAHIRATMEQDGAALAEFFAWFESALGKELITELTIDEKIVGARARRPGFVCPSFSTIAALNANGAQPHYRATDGVARHDRHVRTDRQRHAADRLRRPVPRRHHRHHARRAGRHDDGGAAARLHAGAQGHDRAVASRAFRAARRVRCSTRWRARRSGPPASTSVTAPATAWATSSTCTRVRTASLRTSRPSRRRRWSPA